MLSKGVFVRGFWRLKAILIDIDLNNLDRDGPSNINVWWPVYSDREVFSLRLCHELKMYFTGKKETFCLTREHNFDINTRMKWVRDSTERREYLTSEKLRVDERKKKWRWGTFQSLSCNERCLPWEVPTTCFVCVLIDGRITT